MNVNGQFNSSLAQLRSGTLGNRPVRTRMRGGVEGGDRNPFLSLLNEAAPAAEKTIISIKL